MPSKLAWKPPSNPKSQLIPGNLHDIAEPVHRIGPQGVSSGVSLREFPLSCTQEIQNICLHYVHKCMGKYEDNKVASRYVYQMSDEILKLLSGALEELKWREDRPIIYQNLLDEWNKCFPESLGIQGSPKFISSKLIKQSKEIEDLKAKVDYLTKSKTTEIEGMKKSVDTQMHSIRQATLQDRKAMESSFKQQEISYSEDLSKLHNYIEVLHDQILELQKEQDNTRQDQLKELENHKSYVDTMNREIANIHENYQQLIKDEKNVQHDLKIQIKSLEESLESEKQKIQSVINAKESTNELYDIISKIEDIATTECDDGKGSDLMTNDLSNRSKSKLNSFKMSTVVDAYIDDINKLKRQINDLQFDNGRQKSEIDSLKSQLRINHNERRFLSEKIEAITKINTTLRNILIDHGYNPDFAGVEIFAMPQILAHTPHFLGRADTSGLLNSHPNMSAYNNAGIF